jgi:mannose/cellobiose epimerase-like protein (N-acyl-D-glucosamine 2-epimerase family)
MADTWAGLTGAGEWPWTEADVTPEMGRERLGNPIGLKDANTNSDLLEAFRLLASVCPDDERVRDRVAEMYEVCLRRMADQSGPIWYLTGRDWTPIPQPERTGYGFQIGYRLIASAETLGADVGEAVAAAARMIDRSMERGWDAARGGFVFALADDDADDSMHRQASSARWPSPSATSSTIATAAGTPRRLVIDRSLSVCCAHATTRATSGRMRRMRWTCTSTSAVACADWPPTRQWPEAEGLGGFRTDRARRQDAPGTG